MRLNQKSYLTMLFIAIIVIISMFIGCSVPQNTTDRQINQTQNMLLGANGPTKSIYDNAVIQSHWWTPDGQRMMLCVKKDQWGYDNLVWSTQATDAYNTDIMALEWQWEVISLGGGQYALKNNYPYFRDGTTSYSYYLASSDLSSSGTQTPGVARITKANEAAWKANQFAANYIGFPPSLRWYLNNPVIAPDPWNGASTYYYHFQSADHKGYLNVEHRGINPQVYCVASPDNNFPIITQYTSVELTYGAPLGWWSSQWNFHWYSDD
jgi:hypothetical protein